MLLPTLAFFMIVIIYYLLQKDEIVNAEQSSVSPEKDISFKLDYPPKNIGCSYESKPLSTINNRMIEPIYCGKDLKN